MAGYTTYCLSRRRNPSAVNPPNAGAQNPNARPNTVTVSLMERHADLHASAPAV